ncbi:glycosyltransferase [Candidatus Wolfebacteria bacterium]|nr:glycosyltransferase [Candidatus Wolfebacteria bacterium]
MKILHIVSSYWPAFEFGGPIQSVYLLNKFLARQGVEITVFTTNSGLKGNKNILLKKEVIIDGVKVFYFPYYGYVHWTFSLALFLALKKNIKNFDVIHITGVWNFPVLAAAFWARFYKKPYIISPRGSLMKEPLQKKSSFIKKLFLFLFVRRDLKNASALHFTAEKEKEEYLKSGLPLKKAIIIPNSFDTDDYEIRNEYEHTKLRKDFREKFMIETDKKIVLFLSRLNWKKGLDTLIPAFAEVIKKESRAVLVLAGPNENNYKKEIENMLRNTKLYENTKNNNKIIFTGMLLGDDKIAAYCESDVFVLPSYSENFGMAVIEAMAAEKPVVITKGVGISNEVEKAGAGIVVEKNVEQIAEAILKVLENPQLGKEMGQRGKKLIEKEFSSEKVAEKWIKEYNNLTIDR